jgi:hypothetical protein
MVYSIRHATPPRPDTSEHLIFTLRPAARPGLAAFRRSLTPEQRHAVVSFLSFKRSLVPPKWRETEVKEADIVLWDEKDA